MPIPLTPILDSSLSYATLDEALDVAQGDPSLAKFRAQDASTQLALLARATMQIDGEKWQGRKFDLLTPQSLEFPRIPDPSLYPFGIDATYPLTQQIGMGPGAVIWDWDAVNNVAVVPQRVKVATVYQAAALLDAARNKRLAARHDGVIEHHAGQLGETFSQLALMPLCQQAFDLLKIYRLRGGSIQ